MNYLVVENGIISNIIVSDTSFALKIGAAPYYDGAEIGATYNPPKPSDPQADTDAMIVDLEYRMTLLELGVTE